MASGNSFKSSSKVNSAKLFVISAFGAILVTLAGTNAYTYAKVKNVESQIPQIQQATLDSIKTETTQVLQRQNAASLDSGTSESGVIIDTSRLMSSEDMQNIIDKVCKICENYLTEDVYKGVEALMADDIQKEIQIAVKESYANSNNVTRESDNTTRQMTSEQEKIITNQISTAVMKEVNTSIKDVKTQMTSANNKIAAIESKITLFNTRIDNLDSSTKSSIDSLKSADTSMKSDISSLRLQLLALANNTNTTPTPATGVAKANLQMLKAQMNSLIIVLNDTEDTINNALKESVDATTKNSYKTTISSYKSQASTLLGQINDAISNGGTEASETMTSTVSSFIGTVAQFGISVDNNKQSIGDLAKLVKDNTDLINAKQTQIDTLKAEQLQLQTEQTALNNAKQTMQDAIDGKISAEQATQKINEIIGDLGDCGTVVAKLSAINEELKNADESAKADAISAAQQKVTALKGEVEAQAAVDRQAVEDAKTALTGDISSAKTGLENIIGTVDAGKTVMGTLTAARDSLAQSISDIDTEKTQAINNLASQTGQDLSAAKNDLKGYINNLPDDSPLKIKLVAIQTEAEQKATKAKEDAIAKVDALDGELTSQITTINNTINSTKTSLQNAIDGKTSAEDVQDEIDSSLAAGGAIATKLGSVQGALNTAITSGDTQTLSDAKTHAQQILDDAKTILDGKISTNTTNISTAQSDISTLNTTMTQKANKTDVTAEIGTAKSQAISTADTNATTKASAAETNAKSYADTKTGELDSSKVDGSVTKSDTSTTIVLGEGDDKVTITLTP